MNRFAKSAILGLAAFATVAVPMADAKADGWDHHRRPMHGARHNDDALLAGLLGLAAGAVIIGALSEPQPRVVYEAPQPRRVYHPVRRPVSVYDYPAAPRDPYDDPEIITYDGGGALEPWSRDWFRYCSNRYNSFNAETGTYRGYDGRDHFCTGN